MKKPDESTPTVASCNQSDNTESLSERPEGVLNQNRPLTVVLGILPAKFIRIELDRREQKETARLGMAVQKQVVLPATVPVQVHRSL